MPLTVVMTHMPGFYFSYWCWSEAMTANTIYAVPSLLTLEMSLVCGADWSIEVRQGSSLHHSKA